MRSPWALGVLLLLVPALLAAVTDDDATRRARNILKKSPVIDGHNDLPWAIRESATAPMDVVAYDLRHPTPGATDFARLREGGVGGQFWSVYTPGEPSAQTYARVQLDQIDIARRMIARYPDALAWTPTVAEAERAMKEGRVASLLGLEGGHAIENSLGALRAYYDLGVRYMTLTHNVTLDWADAALDKPRHDGLTRFGEEVVREMNRLGMLVDLSHVAPSTMRAALRVSTAPVIFSHSSCRALCDMARNVPDDVLEELKKNGGVIMITFVAPFISPEVNAVYMARKDEITRAQAGITDEAEKKRIEKELKAKRPLPKTTIARVADHLDHARKVAGVDHIGIGGDYDGNDEWPEGLEDVSSYPRLFAELVRRGWSDADLAKLAQGNVLRVLAEAETVAKRLQAERPASVATIEALDGPAAKAGPTP